MDVYGWRQELFDMTARYAQAGLIAVLPQLFHRIGSPGFPTPAGPGEPLPPGMNNANDVTSMDDTVMDTGAIVAALQVGSLGATATRISGIGYCMGGRHALAAQVAYPDAIGAGISAHGGRLVTPDETSPHLLVAKVQGPFHFAMATDDPVCPDAHQEIIKAEAQRKPNVTWQKMAAPHGWSFRDRYCYDEAAAEAIWDLSLNMFA
jgi:carboxymethylenebutenolidase